MIKYKTVTSLAAILSFINGCFFILVPAFSLSILGRETNLIGITTTRYFGAGALGLAVITWLARNTPHPEVRRLVSYGMLTTLALLVVIDLVGLLTGAMNYMGWLLFITDLLLSLGFIASIFTGGGRE